jgi:hypothetical protein
VSTTGLPLGLSKPFTALDPAGGKWWRLKYRFAGKEKRLSLGVSPDVSLKDARDSREECRKMLAGGVDPSANRKARKSASSDRASNSFEVVTREWFAKFSPGWAVSHSGGILEFFERDVFPWLGDRAISDVTAKDLSLWGPQRLPAQTSGGGPYKESLQG